MKHTRVRQCRCCQASFVPTPCNARKQLYCGKPECRKASKSASQRRWTGNNPDYFKDEVHVDRVRAWRRDHPKHPRPKRTARVLQDNCTEIPVMNQSLTEVSPVQLSAGTDVLQDNWIMQHPV